ncbi:MAG: hypothetical protein FWH15_04775 [Betaproteobacteria bacterium]|nr:hypothetical protein [Betaproteobacteria bacterium]
MTGEGEQHASEYPANGADWTEEHWQMFLEELIEEGIISWREVTATTLGNLNPSQVGTSIASKKSFQRHFPPRKCWEAVRTWHFMQNGKCADCGTRVDLQADHVIPKEFVGDVGLSVQKEIPDLVRQDCARIVAEIKARLVGLLNRHNYTGVQAQLLDNISGDLYNALTSGSIRTQKDLEDVADRLDNMILRCRRHNVIRRPSHANGGLTFLTAEAGLMWLLFVHRPSNYRCFHNLCREYGLTMANIRFEEAWAMARWLQQIGLYEIEPGSKYSHAPTISSLDRIA